MDERFSWYEEGVIQEAALEWYEATDSDDACLLLRFGHSRPEIITKARVDDDDEDPFIYRIHQTDLVYEEVREHYQSGFHGYRGHGGILLLPGSVSSSEEFKETVLHELGHEFGLNHDDGELMNFKTYTPCIDEVSLRAFCQLHSCGPRAHTTCETHGKE